MASKNTENRNEKSFWATLPGMLTGCAAVITAIGGLIAVLVTAGIIKSGPSATSAPPVTETPPISFSFHPNSARRGEDVNLYVSPPGQNVTVFFDGRPLPKKAYDDSARLVVTVPGDANSGYFELEWKGIRFRASEELIVLP
jgi:hypothetical protein